MRAPQALPCMLNKSPLEQHSRSNGNYNIISQAHIKPGACLHDRQLRVRGICRVLQLGGVSSHPQAGQAPTPYRPPSTYGILDARRNCCHGRPNAETRHPPSGAAAPARGSSSNATSCTMLQHL
jgi:hypothetical protein